MAHALTIAFDILSLTSILVLLVLGMGVIVSMMGVFNLAHGELVLLGATTTWVITTAGAPAWVGILAAPLVVAVIGIFLERLVIRHFYAKPIIGLLGTWGLGIAIREAVRGILGGVSHSVAAPIAGTVTFAGASISSWRIVVVVITLATLAGCTAFLRLSRFGLQVRATLENPMLSRASGIAVSRIYTLTFGFGAALAGLAGAMLVPLFSLYADLGITFLVRSFLAVMAGGMGTFEAPIGGAIVIGASSAGVPFLISPLLADVLVFLAAITIVRFRPQGIFGGTS